MSWTGVLILRIVINLTAVRIFRSSVIKRSQCLHSKPRLVRPLELWKVYFAASVCSSDNPVSFTPKAKNKYWLSMRRISLRCLQSTRLQTHNCLDRRKKKRYSGFVYHSARIWWFPLAYNSAYDFQCWFFKGREWLREQTPSWIKPLMPLSYFTLRIVSIYSPLLPL